jgi:adenylate cyclase
MTITRGLFDHQSLLRDRFLRLSRSAGFKALIAAHAIVAAIILVRNYGGLQPLELAIYDELRVVWAGDDRSASIILVGATETDVKHLGWPLRDGDLATLLERITAWKPRVIAVDLYRDDPEPPGTDRLETALARHKEIIWAFKLPDERKPAIPPPPILRGTDRAVFTDVVTDAGNVVRRGLLYADDGVHSYTGVGMAVALGYLARDGIEPGPAPDGQLRLGKASITPLDDTRGPYTRLDSRGYQILLDYHGGPHPFVSQSLGEIMRSDAAASLVRGRAVIIGITAESVKDLFSTPFDSGFNNADPIYGITVHAHIADQLIRAAINGMPMLCALPSPLEDLWIWVWAIAGLVVGMLLRHPIPAICGSIAGLLILVGTVYAAFGQAVLLAALPAAIAWVASAGFANRAMRAASYRSRTLLLKSFEHYLAPAVIQKMISSEALPTLGGEQQEISVLFTDLAGSTATAETMEPELLIRVFNEYFEGVCAAISEQGGTVNEFVGDEVLALFGAPDQQPDHADRAVEAAIAIDQFACHFSIEQKRRGIDFGSTRIGVHTGIALVGNIGTRARFKYGAQGDVLNTGSRLEGLNKTIGTRICVSGETARNARHHRFRPVGSFVVKGRRDATDVFEPVASFRSCEVEWVERYEAAYRALEMRQLEAADLFKTLYREKPEDACVAFHHRRLIAGETGTLIVMPEK